MPKKNNSQKNTLSLSKYLYPDAVIKKALDDFSQSGEFSLKKEKTYTVISFPLDSDELKYEFANYVLFLTIQNR